MNLSVVLRLLEVLYSCMKWTWWMLFQHIWYRRLACMGFHTTNQFHPKLCSEFWKCYSCFHPNTLSFTKLATQSNITRSRSLNTVYLRKNEANGSRELIVTKRGFELLCCFYRLFKKKVFIASQTQVKEKPFWGLVTFRTSDFFIPGLIPLLKYVVITFIKEVYHIHRHDEKPDPNTLLYYLCLI